MQHRKLDIFGRSSRELVNFPLLWSPPSHEKRLALSNSRPVLALQQQIPIPLHKQPRRLYELLHLLHAQLDIERHEAPLGEVDVVGEHVVVEEGGEVGG